MYETVFSLLKTYVSIDLNQSMFIYIPYTLYHRKENTPMKKDEFINAIKSGNTDIITNCFQADNSQLTEIKTWINATFSAGWFSRLKNVTPLGTAIHYYGEAFESTSDNRDDKISRYKLIIDILLNNGADLFEEDDNGFSPLQNAEDFLCLD